MEQVLVLHSRAQGSGQVVLLPGDLPQQRLEELGSGTRDGITDRGTYKSRLDKCTLIGVTQR